jgi:hypothetical protein
MGHISIRVQNQSPEYFCENLENLNKTKKRKKYKRLSRPGVLARQTST